MSAATANPNNFEYVARPRLPVVGEAIIASGWLLTIALLNLFYAISVLAGSHIFITTASWLVGDTRPEGWLMLIVALIQLAAAPGVLLGKLGALGGRVALRRRPRRGGDHVLRGFAGHRDRSPADRYDSVHLPAERREERSGLDKLMATGKDKLSKLLDQFKEEPRGAWLTEDAPQEAIPEHAMDSIAAMRLVDAGARRRGNPGAEPGDLRHHLDGA